MSKYSVIFGKVASKGIASMPLRIRDRLAILVDDIEANGPHRTNWANYSSLGGNRHHCHLAYKWVACWKVENGNAIVEFYYVGSRESAPY